ncbi:hypothetical protein EAG_11903 [Camponotus floridanus]|uniref:Uncharacterized protein n=1 Tax=Camponotus floridanus TaxID=104421 RepID=E2A518_CAMFO|nr:hypothetical protein EAG_11903 [Camponotus floridanus]
MRGKKDRKEEGKEGQERVMTARKTEGGFDTHVLALRVIERKGTPSIVLIVRMEKLKDREELLERRWEFSRNWEVGVMRS